MNCADKDRIGLRVCRAVLAVSCVTVSARAAEFIRGDANVDGVVSLADSYWLEVARDLEGTGTDCLSAADANDDGRADIADGIWIINYLFRGGPEMPSPFPRQGSDPTGDALDCTSASGAGPVADPDAELKVIEAQVITEDNPKARIVIALRGSRAVAGFSGEVRLPGPIFSAEGFRVLSTIKSFSSSELFLDRRIGEGNRIRFAYLTSLADYLPFDTSEAVRELGDVRVVEVQACLQPGLAAGDYPIVFEEGELVDADSGQRIPCRLTGGVLHVESPVSSTAFCGNQEPPPHPDTLDVAYRLGSVTSPPGSETVVPFFIQSNSGVQGYAFSVDFDEQVLHGTKIEQAWEKPDGSDYDFAVYEINNENVTRGGEGVDEGFVVGAAVFDFDFATFLPPGVENLALRLHFAVEPGATASLTALEFRDGGQGSGTPVVNSVTAFGEVYIPERVRSFVFLDGILHILPDITLFVRGDSNGDGVLDISDPITTLEYLFLAESPPTCFDAADADDDGSLLITDAVFTLGSLFLGGKVLPPPFPAAGEDPTPDALGCLYRDE